MPTTNRFGVTAAERAESLRELNAYCLGYIEDPGSWDPLEDDSLTVEDDDGSEDYGPTMHECPEPRIPGVL